MGNNRSICGAYLLYCIETWSNRVLSSSISYGSTLLFPSFLFSYWFNQHAKEELAFLLYWPDEDAGVTAGHDEGSCTWEQVVSVDNVQLNDCGPE